MVLSQLAVATLLLSGLHATITTGPVCPRRVRITSPLLASQIFAVVSSLAVASLVPSGLQVTLQTLRACPISVSTVSLTTKCCADTFRLVERTKKRNRRTTRMMIPRKFYSSTNNEWLVVSPIREAFSQAVICIHLCVLTLANPQEDRYAKDQTASDNQCSQPTKGVRGDAFSWIILLW